MTDTPADPSGPRASSIEELVGDWLTVPDVAQQLGLPLSTVRRMIEDRDLVAWRVGERRVVSVPARFVEEAVMRHLPGTFTVLADSGMSDEELLRWLFTPDATLPEGGSPVDALAAGFKTEVRRRAMESAW